MGLDVNRFKTKISEKFLCNICEKVLDDAVQTLCKPESYCRKCIDARISRNESCMNCKRVSNLNSKHLKPLPKQLEALLNNLEIRCDFASFGCRDIVKLNQLDQHLKGCPLNPDANLKCNDCGAVYKKRDACEHWCVSHLKGVLEVKQQQILLLNEEKDKQLQEITDLVKDKKDLKKEVNRLKGEVKERNDRLQEVTERLKHTERERQLLEPVALPVSSLNNTGLSHQWISTDIHMDMWPQCSGDIKKKGNFQDSNRFAVLSDSAVYTWDQMEEVEEVEGSSVSVKRHASRGSEGEAQSQTKGHIITVPVVKKMKTPRLKLPPGEDAQEVERKAIERLKQYLKVKSKEDAVLEVIETFNEKNVHLYVKAAFNQGLDYSPEEQAAIGQLLRFLVVNRIINERSFFEGLHLMLEFSDDLAFAFPHYWEDMGQMLAPFLIDLSRDKRKQFFANALIPCIESGTAGRLMANVVKCAADLTNSVRVKNAWISSGLSWSDFLSQDKDIDEFLVRNELEYLTI